MEPVAETRVAIGEMVSSLIPKTRAVTMTSAPTETGAASRVTRSIPRVALREKVSEARVSKRDSGSYREKDDHGGNEDSAEKQQFDDDNPGSGKVGCGDGFDASVSLEIEHHENEKADEGIAEEGKEKRNKPVGHAKLDYSGGCGNFGPVGWHSENVETQKVTITRKKSYSA